jgi:DNA adenine methylase
MRTLYRYPGAKNKLLPQIMPFIESSLEKTGSFCDAFVGGGSVLLEVAAKYPNVKLYCNDKDWFVFCFWKLMATGSSEDIEQLKRLVQIKPTIELYYELRAEDPTSEVEAAFRSIFFNRTSFSGDMRRSASAIGGKSQSSKYTVDCRYNAAKIIQKIDAIHKLLAGRTVVSNVDINAYEVINDESITLYLDPPYWLAGKMLYQEYMKDNEHTLMANRLKSRKDWILSYDNCKEIVELYDWADIHLIDASYCIRGIKTNWQKTKEVLILPA